MTTLVSTLHAGKVSVRNRAMPGPAFPLPTNRCKTGRKLATIEGSVCHGCYAVKSERMYPSVDQGHAANYLKATRMIAHAPNQWAKAMAHQISHHCQRLGQPFMRWFDSGDLQSVDMLHAIVLTCKLTPHIKHWLPTREATMVKQWRDQGGLEPVNLVIRISSTMIGDVPRKAPHTSTVHHKGTFDAGKHGRDCPKANHSHKTNSCEDCRTCWDKSVPNVSYQFHR